MRTNINLATHPWVDTATIMRRLRTALIVLVSIALLCLLGLKLEQHKADVAKQQRDQMDRETAAMQQEKQTYQAELKLPGNQAILARAQMLNQIFAGKSFSWTAVMMDLEHVLPVGVQVVALEPTVLPDGSIVIRLRVNGERDKAIELVRNLELSKRFRAPRLAGESVEASSAQRGAGFRPTSTTAGGVTFDILSEYNPLTENEKLTSDKTTVQSTTVKTTVLNKSRATPKMASRPPMPAAKKAGAR